MIALITLTTDQGDGWLCTVDETGETAYLYASMANDYPDHTTLLAALVPNREPYPKWFVAAVLPIDTPVTRLDGVHEGWDAYLDLMSKARMCRKIIDLSDRSKVWYAPNDSEIYVEEFEYD